MNKPPELPVPGEFFRGKYRIQRLLGKGGMGAVFAAHHEALDMRVAVKFLLAEAASNEEANARFKQEARAAARIQNEHVAHVVDVSTDGGLPYMVMEYLDGQDLSQLLEERRSLPPEEACSYVLQAADAIHAAHRAGIIHRDLKPSNLFLAHRPDGTSILKVLDFGISKTQNGLGPMSGALTSTKAMLGSPLYMSPEQLRSSKSVDVRADIWALGVILYELITGAVPYAGENLGELFAAILEQDPVPVRQRAPHVPPELEATIMRCLQRQPSARFGSVAELALQLAPFAPSQSGLAVLAAGRTQLQAGGFASPASYTQPIASSAVAYGPGHGQSHPASGSHAHVQRASQPSAPAFLAAGGTGGVPAPNATAAIGGGFVAAGAPSGHSATGAGEPSAAGLPGGSSSALLLGIAAVMVLAALGIGGYTLSQRSAASAAAAGPSGSAPAASASAPPTASVSAAPSASPPPPAPPPPPTASAVASAVASASPAPPTQPKAPVGPGPGRKPTVPQAPPTPPPAVATVTPPATPKPSGTLQTSR